MKTRKTTLKIALAILFCLVFVSGNANNPTVTIGALKYTLYNDGNASVAGLKNVTDAVVVIPPQIQFAGAKYTIIAIESSCFEGCKSLKSITIPNSVTEIGPWAFYDCTSLTSVTIPNSVTAVRDYAFSDCTSLTSVTIPNSVTEIDKGAFSGCTSLTSVTIPNSVTKIDKWAFSDCTSLKSIAIPKTTTTDREAFENYTSVIRR